MANLTKAERHNRMLNNVFDTYHKQQLARKDTLPTCNEYSFFLDKAVTKFGISINDARSKFGLLTYGQWKELLQLF